MLYCPAFVLLASLAVCLLVSIDANRTLLFRWSVGSLLFLSSWAFMMGPYQYAVHLISGPRLPFTATYLGAIVLTIYFAVGVSLLSTL